jgi:HupE/UreJ protein
MPLRRITAEIMCIINFHLLRMAVQPSLHLFLSAVLCIYCSSAAAHDPGLSMVDIQLNNDQFFAHITYARKDIEQLIQLDKDHRDGISNAEFAQAQTGLKQFITAALEFSIGKKIIHPQSTDIQLDKSDAIHFRLQFLPAAATNITIYSTMIDQFSLGHRQFVKVKTTSGLISSRILSARDPLFEIYLPRPDLWGVFNNFVVEGVWHIWIGFDHILFVVTLLLPAVLLLKQGQWLPGNDFRHTFSQTVKVISAFTIAHSLTLALTVFNVLTLPAQAVESIIAATVIIAAVNNIYKCVEGRLWMLAFVFGLIHGMGFASVLLELGLPSNTQALALIAFNIGVEIGQIAIIIAILPTLYYFRTRRFYRPLLIQGGSWMIVVIASIWFFERITETTLSQYLI